MKKGKTIEKKESDIEKEIVRTEEDVKRSENKQLTWFFVIVGLIFAAVLVPYFWNESSKSFEFGGADWVVEDYEYLKIYHGRFLSFGNPNLFYNVYLRTDPRENDVVAEGTFDQFKYGGIISFAPEVDACRGELGRGVFDLSAFLRQGVGVGPVESGSTDKFVAVEEDRRFATCNTVLDRTLVIVEIGEDSKVFQDEKNSYCYTIVARDCEDFSGIERFIAKSILDFDAARNETSV
jgi:hypothetical protein